ncbi:uncharacterized protein LOC121429629 [Lytechinus variegatus]|uniref:uncharacterized protein LOC121429629 n=1 Tax=Lytechinus variegatus TaxID=7654 RepID=UPI001BB2BB06|nr:uncharacterized protein LOC121429629 [Lytechinus variegatus]
MPPPERRQVFSAEEACELVTMDNGEYLNVMDSDSESEQYSDDEAVHPSPTRSNQEDDDFVNDLDSEYESDPDANADDEPEVNEDKDAWVHLQEWNLTWYTGYDDGAKLLFDIQENSNPVHYFYQFFPEQLLQTLQTRPIVMLSMVGPCAEQCLATRRPLQQHSRINKWAPTKACEMKAFTGLQITNNTMARFIVRSL